MPTFASVLDEAAELELANWLERARGAQRQ